MSSPLEAGIEHWPNRVLCSGEVISSVRAETNDLLSSQGKGGDGQEHPQVGGEMLLEGVRLELSLTLSLQRESRSPAELAA